MAKFSWAWFWKLVHWIERFQTIMWLVALVLAGGVSKLIITVLQVLGYVSGPWLIALACGIFVLVMGIPILAVERGWLVSKRQNKTTMVSQKESTTTLLITDVRTEKMQLYRLNREQQSKFTRHSPLVDYWIEDNMLGLVVVFTNTPPERTAGEYIPDVHAQLSFQPAGEIPPKRIDYGCWVDADINEVTFARGGAKALILAVQFRSGDFKWCAVEDGRSNHDKWYEPEYWELGTPEVFSVTVRLISSNGELNSEYLFSIDTAGGGSIEYKRESGT